MSSLPPLSNYVLDAAQAGLVALPGAGLPRWIPPLRSRAWALVLPGSIVGVIGGISLLPGLADVLTYLALVACPLLAAAALAWADRRLVHPAWILLAAGLLALAIADRGTVPGDLAATTLTALSCVTLARLLVAVAPATLVKLALVVMAVIDAYLVFSTHIDKSNDALNAAAPALGLPQLQVAALHGSLLGYGDLFVAAVLGALLAAEHRPQGRAALLTLLALAAFDVLFLWFDTLPATVPVAVVLVGLEGWHRRCRHGTPARADRSAARRPMAEIGSPPT